MAKIIELNNDLLLSKVGGLALTITDTDTGAINPVDLRCGRAGERTGINKDGEIYTARPYEPAFELKDGEMTVSKELGATNLITQSNNPNDSSWERDGTVSITLNTDISPDGGMDAHTVSGATGISFRSNNFNYNLSGLTPNSQITHSVWLKSKGASLVRLMGRRDNGVIVFKDCYVTGEWLRYDISLNIEGFGNTQFLIGGSDGDFLFYESQSEDGDVATSNIPTDGLTGVRLADTGFITPDLSEYINSESFTLEVFSRVFQDGLLTNEAGLSNGSFATATRISYTSNTGEVLAVLSKSGEATKVLTASGVSKEDFNNAEILVEGTNVSLIINDITQDSGTFFGYSENDLKFFSYDNGQGGSQFSGQIKGFKIQ